MKKLLLMLRIISLAACASEDYTKYDAIFEGCERIETTAEHLVYKCPVTQEWVAAVKAIEPNGKFFVRGNLNIAELYADTENVYSELVFNDEGNCAESYTIRTMVAEPTETADWAVIGCR